MGKSSQYKYRGSKLSDPCPTIDSLIALGFERREPKYGAETAAYRFPNLELEAIHVMNLYARYVVLLSGFLNTGRTMATIEDQIPTDLESALEAAAWVSYALRSHKSDLGPLPGLVRRRRTSLGPRGPRPRGKSRSGKAAGLRGQSEVLCRQGLCPTSSA